MLKYMHFSAATNAITKGSDANYTVPANGDFIWVFAQRPNEQEITKMCTDFSIEQKFFRTFAKEHRSVRYSTSPLVFVFMDYYLENNHIKNSRILFILKENALIIVMQHQNIFHNDLFEKLVNEFKPVKRKSLARLMYQFLSEDVEENYDVLEKVETTIMHLEKEITKSKNERVQDVIKLKRAIYRMSRRFWGSAKIVYVVKKGLTPLKMDLESTRLLDDVYNTYMHQIDILSSAKEMLSDILVIQETASANDLNVIIKKLTSFTIILLIPALIAGIYGMNFDNIPELHWRNGFYVALGMMAASMVLTYYAFHKRKWV